MPSEVSGEIGLFDRFAGWAASIAARAPFFAFCVLLVVVWLIQGIVTLVVTRDLSRFLDDTYQLEINTTTTIITFLMVALLQNASTRGDQATQHKLNAGFSRDVAAKTRVSGSLAYVSSQFMDNDEPNTLGVKIPRATLVDLKYAYSFDYAERDVITGLPPLAVAGARVEF